ncbi:hypothetical protein H6F67_23795 [Microcoleus sp. FACHB-1515]|uniref:WD40 repeat domain-containing protein n=1 Tax=Cyanophyceae TaxID=3028117 RepID=UPI001688BE2C|nr:hypothetical protein [Microcoleus sp. FACHB-1515]MBD2092876.1 hypothetical protein [Microcoleus sp. FACHB-1515]
MKTQRLGQLCLLTALLGLAQPAILPQSARSQPVPATPVAARPQLVRTVLAHDGPIASFAFSPNSRTLVTSGRDRTVRVFQDLGLVQDLRIDSDVDNTWFSWVAVSPDGQTLVTSRSDGTIQLRDFGGTVKTTLSYPSRGEGRVAIAANNRTLIDATGFNGNFGIRLWDLTTQQHRYIGGNWATHTAITPDGYILVAGSSTGTATVWNLNSGRRIVTFPAGATERMTAIAISADGLRVYVAKRNRLEEWNARSGTLTRNLLQTPGTAQIQSLAVHPDGQRMAIGFRNYIQLRDLRTNRPLHNLAANSSFPPLLSFSPDGRYFVNTDWLNDRLRVWRL